MKYSKQREVIYNWVVNNPVHPTADEVYTNLKPTHPALSLGTVYRNLNLLAENDRLIKIKVPNASDRFDASMFTHHHMICEECGAVYDVKLPQLDEISKEIETQTEFILSEINVVFHGTCKECNAKKLEIANKS